MSADFGKLARNNEVEGNRIEGYLELTKICNNQNFFKFGGKYQQKLGMGNILSPFLGYYP